MGLLRGERARSRWIPAWLTAAMLAGMLIGWGGAHLTSRADDPDGEAAATSDPLQAAQQVQQTGTAHALALEALVRSLEHAELEDLMLGQQVTMAALRAQARALERLVSRNAATILDPAPPSAQPVIWF
jgi:hypothetical protein